MRYQARNWWWNYQWTVQQSDNTIQVKRLSRFHVRGNKAGLHIRRLYKASIRNLVQELPGKDTSRVPLLLQRPQFIQFSLAPEAELDWVSPGCILEVGILSLVWASEDGNALLTQLSDSLVPCRIRVLYNVVPGTNELVTSLR